MTPAELAAVVEAHGKWRRGEEGGSRANLTRAYLTGADLTGADLAGANLTRANLTRADLADANLTGADLADAYLTGANLTRANLTRAYLTGADLAGADLADANLADANLTRANLTRADLAGANLSAIREDFVQVLNAAPAEVPGLLEALRAGKVDGSTYEGDCACLVGTIANVRGCYYGELGALKPDSSRPAERWFLAIAKGSTPENNPVAKITEGWIVEWLANGPAALPTPTETPVASTEAP